MTWTYVIRWHEKWRGVSRLSPLLSIMFSLRILAWCWPTPLSRQLYLGIGESVLQRKRTTNQHALQDCVLSHCFLFLTLKCWLAIHFLHQPLYFLFIKKLYIVVELDKSLLLSITTKLVIVIHPNNTYCKLDCLLNCIRLPQCNMSFDCYWCYMHICTKRCVLSMECFCLKNITIEWPEVPLWSTCNALVK